MNNNLNLIIYLFSLSTLCISIFVIAKKNFLKNKDNICLSFLQFFHPNEEVETVLSIFLEKLKNLIHVSGYYFYLYHFTSDQYKLIMVKKRDNENVFIAPAYAGLFSNNVQDYQMPPKLSKGYFPKNAKKIQLNDHYFIAIPIHVEKGMIILGPYHKALSKKFEILLTEIGEMINVSLEIYHISSGGNNGNKLTKG